MREAGDVIDREKNLAILECNSNLQVPRPHDCRVRRISLALGCDSRPDFPRKLRYFPSSEERKHVETERIPVIDAED